MEPRKAIRPGCGYWQIDDYPIGGSFRRTPRDGQLLFLKDLSDPVESIKGKMILATTSDGRRIAVSPSLLTR